MSRHCITCLLMFLFLQGCATNAIRVQDGEAIESETVQLQESRLLDVGILLFENGEITEDEEGKSVHEDIRAAESRYMAFHLKETLEQVDSWGAVRVLPAASHIADVTVQGSILSSNGEMLEIQTRVSDSTGALWFEKKYRSEIDESTYMEIEPGEDVYQHVYNRIVNDMSRHRKKLADRELDTIRNTSELRYAAGVSPDPFSEYLVWMPDGHTGLNRLPARDDPMLQRVRKIREREFLFIDTINEYYSTFHSQMFRPYENWRRFYLVEVLQKRAIERRANRTKFAAAAIILVGLLRDYPGLVTTGALLYKDGMDISQEAEIHDAAIRELGDSLKTEVRPMVLDIKGRTVKITGTVEQQYEKWRALLREIYASETGPVLDDSALGSTRL